ncbi:kynureninase [Yunchengibacter salinarum]|uniref:kynureninase n=1 Tax=Yunchengibacter salinarum TaxID=3133399 RepID=UPI0035B620EC
MPTYSLDWCKRQDENDPLAPLKNRFELPDGTLYLDGNSLGPMPKAVGPKVEKTLYSEWRRDLIRSWADSDWYDLGAKCGARIAPLIGADPASVIAVDTVSINIFKLAAAAIRRHRDRTGRSRCRLVTEAGNFSTDIYMLDGLASLLGPDVVLDVVPREAVMDSLGEDVALLLLTHVHFVSAEMWPMQATTEAAHAAGAQMLWDLSHSTGAVPLDLKSSRAEYAVGCGYKYLNGGPGAPAFAYVREDLIADLDQPLTGWFGHKTPFAFHDKFEADPGLRRLLTGTPGILGLRALDAALDLWADVDMALVREKSLALGDLFMDLAEEKLAPFGVHLASPRAHDRRGSHIALRFEHGYNLVQSLMTKGVVGDFRGPDVMRFALTPLYTGYGDIHRAVTVMESVLSSGLWRRSDFARKGPVT